MKRLSSMLAVGALLVCGHVATGDDMFPPEWRGQPGTVTAAWSFWGPAGSGPRTLTQSEDQLVQANPGGFTSAFPARAYFNSNVAVQDALWQRQSVLEVMQFGRLSFGLENYPGGPEKELLIQITFRPGYGAPMSFDVAAFDADPADPPWDYTNTIAATVIDSFVHEDGWQTNSYGFTLEPNPNFEAFSINFTQYPAFIDQVVIDTWCVPEPATLTFLGCMGLFLVQRR